VDRIPRLFTTASGIDGAVCTEPHRSAVARGGGKVLFDSSQMPGQIATALVVRADVLASQRDAVANVISAWTAGVDYLHKNPAVAAEILCRREHTTPSIFTASLKLARFVKPEESRAALASADTPFWRELQKSADFMLQHDLLRAPVAAASLRDGPS
jgi:NitT/TauT family transport system substrate-binding protein